MNRSLTIALSMLLSAIPALLSARDLTPDEQAFFNKHTPDFIRFETQRLDSPAVAKVFSTPFYTVKVVLKYPDSEQSSDLIVARMGDGLVSASRPSSDSELPDVLKMLSPGFKLQTDADAATLQQALDAAYPIVSDSDRKAEAFHHTGHTWIFVRGDFFDSKLGYFFETEANGMIKAVKFKLKLP